MNRYRTITNICSDMGCLYNVFICHGKTRLFLRTSSVKAPCLVRTHATATEQHPNSDSGKRPKLRAIDLARKVQQEKKRTEVRSPPASPQEKRVLELKQFTQQLLNVHPNVLAKHLHKTTVFQNKDLVVINKPYGIPVQDVTGCTSISSVLPILVKMMDGMKDSSQLYPCLGLEKEVTGALVLAKSEEMMNYVQNLHVNHQIERKYWVITVGVPVPSEGVIDIPLIEREVSGPKPHYKMGLSPMFKVNDTGEGVTRVRANRQAEAAATKYSVLDSRGGCSLVELQPLTGVKHQMRVHMALALGCPILGDHKYSHWSKLAPQKLPDGVLRKLKLEQSKARYLPLHLHAKQLTMKGSKGRPDVDVSCRLPKYFNSTKELLALCIPTNKSE